MVECKEGGSTPTTTTPGATTAGAVNKVAYCRTDKWQWKTTPSCPIGNLTPTKAKSVFKGKNVAFLGDSIVRNVYYQFITMMEPTYSNNGSSAMKHSNLHYSPTSAVNTTVWFYWAPFVTNITSTVVKEGLASKMDLIVAGSAAWDALYQAANVQVDHSLSTLTANPTLRSILRTMLRTLNPVMTCSYPNSTTLTPLPSLTLTLQAYQKDLDELGNTLMSKSTTDSTSQSSSSTTSSITSTVSTKAGSSNDTNLRPRKLQNGNSARSASYVWLQPTTVVDAHLVTADKQKYMAEDIMMSYRKAFLTTKAAVLARTTVDTTGGEPIISYHNLPYLIIFIHQHTPCQSNTPLTPLSLHGHHRCMSYHNRPFHVLSTPIDTLSLTPPLLSLHGHHSCLFWS